MIFFNSATQLLLTVFLNLVWAKMETDESKGQLKKSFGSLLKNIVDINDKRMSAMKKLNNLQEFMVTKNSLAGLHGLNLDDDDSAENLRDQQAMFTFVDMRKKLTLRRTHSKQQAAAKNNIKIVIPFNSFNVNSEYINYKNNRTAERNDYNGNIEDKSNDNEEIRNKPSNLGNKYYVHYKAGDRNLKVNDNKVKIYNRNYDDISSSVSDDNYQIDIINEDYDERDRETHINKVTRKNWRGSCDKNAVKTCRSACVDAHKNGCMIYKCSRRAKKAFSKECKRSCRDKFLIGRYSDSDWEME